MSCEACLQGSTYPYRWKDARVMITACTVHGWEIFTALTKAQQAAEDEEKLERKRGGDKSGAGDRPGTSLR